MKRKPREIGLVKSSQVVLIDNEDYEWLSQYKWYLSHGYAVRYAGRDNNGKQIMSRMSREILEKYGHDIMNKYVDHADGNTLNNQKYNLRLATPSQNQYNQKRRKDNTSGYKGVSWSKILNCWEAYITVNHKRIRLGHYDDPVEAAKAYDICARDYHKEFALLNFPNDISEDVVLKKPVVITGNNNSGYRGVSHRNDSGRWRMDFSYKEKKATGTFESALEAAIAYDEWAYRYLGDEAKLNFPKYPANKPKNIQQLIRSYYTQWMGIKKHKLPDLTDCLDFMITEVSEAIELRLRRDPFYVRNNPRSESPTDKEIGIEVFDAIMMGCIAMDILGLDLEEIAQEKLEYMHKKRMGNNE